MGLVIRLVVAVLIALASLFGFYSSSTENPVTGENQKVAMTPAQEIALGQRAAGEMIAKHGGLVQSEQLQTELDELGRQLTESSTELIPYEYDFHLLNDPSTVNAFALPGGQVFITLGLYNKLESKDQLAAILSHEAAHVLARHSSEQLAKAKLRQGLTGAAILATFDPADGGSVDRAQMAMLLGRLIDMKFSREDEIEADLLGVDLLMANGYDPQAMVEVMKILESAAKGQAPPEFASTHPSPSSRVERIQKHIESRSI